MITAEELFEAERTGAFLPAPEVTAIPQDEAEAIQDRFLALWSPKVAGWKIGASTGPVRERFGLARAFWGAIPEGRILPTGAKLPVAETRQRVVELEITFRLAADLPPEACIAREAVAAAVAGVCAAIELPQSRFIGGPGGHGPGPLIADNGAAGHCAVGELNGEWDEAVLARAATTVYLDGVEAATGTGSSILGGPFGALVDHVRYAHARGYTLRAGDYILTGATIVIMEPKTPTEIHGVIEGVGEVRLSLT